MQSSISWKLQRLALGGGSFPLTHLTPYLPYVLLSVVPRFLCRLLLFRLGPAREFEGIAHLHVCAGGVRPGD